MTKYRIKKQKWQVKILQFKETSNSFKIVI